MLIAVDFDDTIATNRYPFVGDLIPYAKEVINMLYSNGCAIMLWTVRGTNEINEFGYNNPHGKLNALDNAKQFCENNGIPINFFNFNPRHPSNSPKQLADYVIDDINLGCPTMIFKNRRVVDWIEVAKILNKEKLISDNQLKFLIDNENQNED